MERRTLGKTGASLSVVGFGGIAVRDEPPEAASRIVGEAINRGINYFDVAPSYGNAEECLGPALKPYRDRVFLACKTGERRAAAAREELHRSLARLQTDHFDLYQCHGVTSMEEVETILGPGGALEAMVQARDDGFVRFLGFSAHSEDAALALLDGFRFDSVLFPINATCWYAGNFGPRVFDRASRLGIGILALKSLARRPWAKDETHAWPRCWYKPVDKLDEAKRLLAFTLSRPVTAAVSPSHTELLWLMCDAAEALEQEPDPGSPDAVPDTAPLFSRS
jgi:aryl-alcohol dehydrogenase-like predicted oxidoreductase